MSILRASSELAGWIDPDLVPRPVVSMGTAGVNAASREIADFDRQEMDFHHHRKGQLLLLLRGVFISELEGGLWMAPPQSAIWVPGGIQHKLTSAGTIECYVVYIDTSYTSNLPSNCCTMAVTPLLRELVIRSTSLPMLYPEGGMETHLITLLLDEIAAAPTENFHLPMPIDVKLRQIVETIMSNPADRKTIQTLAYRAGLSERTLARRIVQETGMSFGRWRQQLQLLLAVKWLSTGASVQQAADGLGYESASSFVTMFRKALGNSPGRYMAERRI